MAAKARLPRRLGLTANPLAYNHLLQTLPLEQKAKRPPRPEPAWNAPPVGSSDESTPSVKGLDSSDLSDISEVELPVEKKAAYTGFRVPKIRVPNYRAVEEGKEKEQDDGHIKPTVFTSRGPSAESLSAR